MTPKRTPPCVLQTKSQKLTPDNQCLQNLRRPFNQKIEPAVNKNDRFVNKDAQCGLALPGEYLRCNSMAIGKLNVKTFFTIIN